VWSDGSEKTAFDKVKDKASDLGHKADHDHDRNRHDRYR